MDILHYGGKGINMSQWMTEPQTYLKFSFFYLRTYIVPIALVSDLTIWRDTGGQGSKSWYGSLMAAPAAGRCLCLRGWGLGSGIEVTGRQRAVGAIRNLIPFWTKQGELWRREGLVVWYKQKPALELWIFRSQLWAGGFGWHDTEEMKDWAEIWKGVKSTFY